MRCHKLLQQSGSISADRKGSSFSGKVKLPTDRFILLVSGSLFIFVMTIGGTSQLLLVDNKTGSMPFISPHIDNYEQKIYKSNT